MTKRRNPSLSLILVEPSVLSHNASGVPSLSRSTTQSPSMNSNSTTKKRMNFNEISQTTIKETKSLSDSGSDSESEFQSARDEAERVAKAKAKRGNNEIIIINLHYLININTIKL